MGRKVWISASTVLVTVVGGCQSSSDEVAYGVASIGAETDTIVTLADCPDAVRATIEAQRDDGVIDEIERTADHGEVLYEVDVTGADGSFEFDVAEDGTFRGFDDDDRHHDDDDDDGDDDDGDDDDEESIPLSEVPAEVRQVALDAVPGLVLREAEREREHGMLVYDLEGDANGHAYSVEVSAEGELVEIELDDDDD